MAPELALASLKGLQEPSLVLDPMAGSGTVLRHASELGHRAIGFDMDPLAVLMSRAWITPVCDKEIQNMAETVLTEADDLDGTELDLRWIDDDLETREFTEYWFAPSQRNDLRRISFVLDALKGRDLNDQQQAAADVIRVALSRTIITKDRGASLARDVSHSRPHKVAENSDFDVIANFERSLRTVRQRLLTAPPARGASVTLGDARQINSIDDGLADLVLTSPPYLNAIDYMRGHRLSLVWFGHTLGSLRRTRGQSIGAERAPDNALYQPELMAMRSAIGQVEDLPTRYQGMILRYCGDVYRMISEIFRILRIGGKAIIVVGNSCLKGIFVRNTEAISEAAGNIGLKLDDTRERELLLQNRYLPLTRCGALGKRIRTETIMTFMKV